MQNEEQKNENTAKSGKSRKGLIIGVIAAVVVVVAIIAVALTMTMGKPAASAESVQNCQLQSEALKAHQDALTTVREGAEEAKAIDGVDASLTQALEDAEAAVDKLGDAPSCPADGSQQEMDEAIASIREYSENLRNATNDLDVAAKAILATVEEE